MRDPPRPNAMADQVALCEAVVQTAQVGVAHTLVAPDHHIWGEDDRPHDAVADSGTEARRPKGGRRIASVERAPRAGGCDLPNALDNDAACMAVGRVEAGRGTWEEKAYFGDKTDTCLNDGQ
jgi:hypothetical protein